MIIICNDIVIFIIEVIASLLFLLTSFNYYSCLGPPFELIEVFE
jgi:hypothetical protein